MTTRFLVALLAIGSVATGLATAPNAVAAENPQWFHTNCPKRFYSDGTSRFWTTVPCNNYRGFADIKWANGAHEYVTVGDAHKVMRAEHGGAFTQLGNGVAKNDPSGDGIHTWKVVYSPNGRVKNLTLRVLGTTGHIYCNYGDGYAWRGWTTINC
ncbi:hypothetical protein ACFTSF_39765 [Kribbella sp. NPDC056951]|uniref:hypothetical protein n=1 Tax=Kribbella sp. NPDC056951 TaxID=3345978 RepID=UPI0036296710